MFRILCRWNLNSGFHSLVGFWIGWPVFRIQKPKISDSTSKKILESGTGIQIPDSLSWGALAVSSFTNSLLDYE